MKKVSKLILALGSTFLCLNAAYSGIPNNDHPTTFLGPTIKGGYTSTFNNYSAYSIAGEAGLKNFRVGGTLGWKLDESQYFKVSAEYLWQNINYAFFSGNSYEWVSQGAIGAGYEYDFLGYSYDPSFDVTGYLSHAPSKNLNTRFGTFVNSLGVLSSFSDARRIAGSNGAGLAPGVSFTPWCGARAAIDLNYDNVRYDKQSPPNEDAKGLGGTVKLKQVLTQDVALDLGAAVRKPFNNYTAGLSFRNVPYFGTWVLGVDGAYTAGKNTLPNTWNVSASANYYLDQRCTSAPRLYKDGARYKDQVTAIPDRLLEYTGDPAVYIPQVLAIVDSRVLDPAPECTPVPSLTGVPIPPIDNESPGTTVTSNSAPSFSPSSGLTYSLTITSGTLTGGNTLTIDPNTGVISAFNGGGLDNNLTVTVTATNRCGQAATSAAVRITYNID